MREGIWGQAASADLASPLADEVIRQRLIERLEARWELPVIVVEAPGGFGKSTLLAQALRSNVADPTGVDLHLACRPPDRDAPRLARRIVELVEPPPQATAVDAEQAAGLVAACLARLAPLPVSLMVDDLHHLRAGDEAVDMLATLVRVLPANAHLVLSGRQIPPLPLARLTAADQVVRIGQDDLAFDTAEASALASHHGAEPGSVEMAGGWPALTRLTLVTDRSASLDYLLEEVVHGLDRDTRIALAAAILGRDVDDTMLADVVETPVRTRDLLSQVPLVSPTGQAPSAGGPVRAHDLWADVLTRLLPRDELERLAVAISSWHQSLGRYEEALEATTTVEAWDQARLVVLRAVEVGGGWLRAASTARWIGAFPPGQHERPELLLLRAATGRMAGDLAAARADAERALELFNEGDDRRAEATAALEVGFIAWLEGDIGRVLEMVAVGERFTALGITSMSWMLDMAYAGFADLQGDTHRALELVEGIDLTPMPSRAAQLVMRWRCVLRLAIGDSAGAVAHAEHLEAQDPTPMMRMLAAGIHWQHGNPERLRPGRVEPVAPNEFGNALDDFLTGAYQAVIAASLGRVADVSPLVPLATDRGREQAYLAIASAASAVAAGDEAGATAAIEQLLDRVRIDDAQCRTELRRFVSLCHPLSERVAAAVDGDELGPRLLERRALARLFGAARRGDDVDWADLPPPPDVLTGLPLRWSLELAARAAADGDRRGVELAEYLLDFVGPDAHQLLQELTSDTRIPSGGIETILTHVPALPLAPVRIITCGPLRVATDAAEPPTVVRRARVRELLALLVLRERITARDAIEMLWPGLEPEGGRNNLRVTLLYLRQILEPDRPKGQPSFHVRRTGGDIWLAPSPLLQVDMWDIRTALTRGREFEQRGRLTEAVDCYHRAVDLWDDEVLAAVREHHELAAAATYLDLELEEAASRVAEWYLATGDNDQAEAIAERLLVHDPYSERAFGVVVSARLARAEISAAGDALHRCRAALAELAVPPSPATVLLIRRFDQMQEGRRT